MDFTRRYSSLMLRKHSMQPNLPLPPGLALFAYATPRALCRLAAGQRRSGWFGMPGFMAGIKSGMKPGMKQASSQALRMHQAGVC